MLRRLFFGGVVAALSLPPIACGTGSGASGPLFVRDMAGDDGRLRVLISGVGKQYLVQCERQGEGSALEDCRSIAITYEDGGRR